MWLARSWGAAPAGYNAFMIATVLKWVAISMVALLIIFWLWSGGAGAVVRFVKTIPNPIDLIWGEGTSTYSVALPWQISIPQGPDISGLADQGDTQLAQYSSDTSGTPSVPQQTQPNGSPSPYAGSVSLSEAAAQEGAPNEEYIEITATGSYKVNLANWSLLSMLTGRRAYLPPAASPYVQGAVNIVKPAMLSPGDTAIITTGGSPVGVSFQENMCTGYLAEHQTFVPQLSNACPSAADAMPLNEQNLQQYGSDCVDYLRRVPQCSFPTMVPASLNNQCRAFIISTLSYNGCLNTNQYRSDFPQDTWRLYLGYSGELWGNTHDVIRLLDENGRTVDSITY